MEALDFQVEIGRRGEHGYEVNARAPDGGEANITMRLAVTAAELEARLGRIQDAVIASSATVRRGPNSQERPVQELGRMLFDALLVGNIGGLLLASRQGAAREDRQLRLVLRVGAPELARLPWEFLFDADEDDYVCLNTPLIRYPTVLESQKALQVSPPLRILAMIGDQHTLAVDDERDLLRRALAELERDGLIELGWVAGQTWRELRDAIHRGPWHVFHFIGHGGFDATAEEGALALTGDDGRLYPLHAGDLAMLLRGHASLRLVLLNACDTGRASALDPFSSVAGALMRRGIPAVVAMQFEITDQAAIEFSRTFYEMIAGQLPVDVAVTEARQAIRLALPGTLEWGTPVLYLRSKDGYIFGRERLEPDQLNDLYTEGRAAFHAEQWDDAVDIFREILAGRRDFKDVAVMLKQARWQQQLDARYTAARTAADAGAWGEAIEHLETLVAAQPRHRDAQARLKQARRERTLAELRAEANRLHRAKKWDAVLAVGEQLLALDPDAADPDGLVSSARAELEAAERSQLLADRYQEALHHIGTKAWRPASAAFQAVEAIDAGYRDTAKLVARVRRERTRTRKRSTTLVGIGLLVTVLGATVWALTPGPSTTPGPFKLTSYASNYQVGDPKNGVGPAGVAFDQKGNLFVANVYDGYLYEVPPGGVFGSPGNIMKGPHDSKPFGLTESRSGRLYADYFSDRSGKVDELYPTDGKPMRNVTKLDASLNGIATDPVSGDLFVSSRDTPGQVFRISHVEDGHGPTSSVYLSDSNYRFDGIAFEPGSPSPGITGPGTLWGVNNDTGSVYGFEGTGDRQPGHEIFRYTLKHPPGTIPRGPSGILALAVTGKEQHVMVNENDGKITMVSWRWGPNPAVKEVDVAAGGTRGDFVTAGPDGCLYATQSSSVEKVTLADGTCSY